MFPQVMLVHIALEHCSHQIYFEHIFFLRGNITGHKISQGWLFSGHDKGHANGIGSNTYKITLTEDYVFT